MIQKFLKAKHWQLFVLQIGIPMLAQILLMMYFLSRTIESNSETMPFTALGYVLPIVVSLYVFFFFGWFWSVGLGINERLPDHLKLNTKLFKAFVLVPATYLIGFSFIMGSIFVSGPKDPSYFVQFVGLILLLHLFSMFCIFYCMHFVAKTIKTAEEKRNVTFSDFAGEFFLIWFYPIGIWILQPRINKLADPAGQEDYTILDDSF